MIKTYKSSDGVTLAYRDEGAGQPLICLAGLTRNSTDFDYLAPHLTDIRMIRPDYRGRGASQWANPSTYTIPIEARDVLELMDHLKLKRAAILGTSRGGLIAMTLAATHKSRLSGVIFNDIGPEIAPEGLSAIMTYLGCPPPQKTYEAVAQAREKFMTGFLDVPKSRWLQEAMRQTRDAKDGLTLTYDAKLRDAVEQASRRPAPDLWPLFDALDGVPLGLIRGANSNILGADTAVEMRRRRPDMIFAEVKNRGHVPFLDEPESLFAIRSFLEQVQ